MKPTNQPTIDIQPAKSYVADIYKFNINTINSMFDLTINNVISWDWLRLKLTKSELKGLADFINNYLENN